ncbi:MAG: hypothetical protein RL743_751, partial [Actinomycetota bacterium]
ALEGDISADSLTDPLQSLELSDSTLGIAVLMQNGSTSETQCAYFRGVNRRNCQYACIGFSPPCITVRSLLQPRGLGDPTRGVGESSVQVGTDAVSISTMLAGTKLFSVVVSTTTSSTMR